MDKLEMGNTLALLRCPHCEIAKPLLSSTPLHYDNSRSNDQVWVAYICSNCRDVVTARGHNEVVSSASRRRRVTWADAVFPDTKAVQEQVPESARRYLEQAHRTLGEAPDAAALVASSSVDAMLKNKGFNDRKKSLHDRINQAVESRLLTEDMGKWAHHVRFVSNNPRHADEQDPHVEPEQARIVVDFADALGEFLFVLPGRAEKAINDVTKPDKDA